MNWKELVKLVKSFFTFEAERSTANNFLGTNVRISKNHESQKL